VSDNPDYNLVELPAGSAGDADVVGDQTRHLMVDIETLGTRPGSAIVSIGAVVFTPAAVVAEWECNVGLKSAMDAGLSVDAMTIWWWMQQSKAAQEATFPPGPTTDIKDALVGLKLFALDYHVRDYWSHGATFDLVLLTEAAHVTGASPMVEDFRRARDTRTLYEITGVNPRTFMGTGTAHNAVDDARAQALAVIESWRILRRWKSAASATQPVKLFTPWGAVGAS
jgi:hypothetical protein